MDEHLDRRDEAPPRPFRDAVWFLVLVLFCIEGGIFLAFAPWLSLWSQNYFFRRYQLLAQIGLHPIARGLVSGIGLALVLHGAGLLRAAVLPKALREP